MAAIDRPAPHLTSPRAAGRGDFDAADRVLNRRPVHGMRYRVRRRGPLSPRSGERYGEGPGRKARWLRLTDQPLTLPLPAQRGEGTSTPLIACRIGGRYMG